MDKLQGFLCAVVSSPDLIPVSRWMPEALGGEPDFESIEQANEFMQLLMEYYNHVVAELSKNQPPKMILKPGSQTDKQLDYQSWCDGYILGWSLSTQEWMSPGNEPLKKLTFPILLLSGAFKEDAESRGKSFMPDDEYQKLEQESADILPNAVVSIYNFWLSKRKSTPIKRDTSKVGRNDLCPCGSGKKFKQCCGNAAKTLH